MAIGDKACVVVEEVEGGVVISLSGVEGSAVWTAAELILQVAVEDMRREGIRAHPQDRVTVLVRTHSYNLPGCR